MTAPDFQLDPRLVCRRAGRAAAGYGKVDTLAREVSRRMGERLDYIRITPTRILDLGCGPGADLPGFAQRYPGIPRIAIDSAPAMLAQARGDTGLLKRLLRFGKPAEPDFICADATALPRVRGVREKTTETTSKRFGLRSATNQSTGYPTTPISRNRQSFAPTNGMTEPSIRLTK